MKTIYRSLIKNGLRASAFMLCLSLVGTSHAQMSGAYTINNGAAVSSTNFLNWTSFVNALRGVARTDAGPNYTGSVTGPVTVTVSGGPYTERITIPQIVGMSSTNTVTIDGQGTVLQWNGASSTRQTL